MAPNRAAFTKAVLTDTSATALVVGGANGASTMGTGGVVCGPIAIGRLVPAPSTEKLYNDAGVLKWNGSAVIVGPAGATNDVQFNDGGAFAADTGVFTYVEADGVLTAPIYVAHLAGDRGDVTLFGDDGVGGASVGLFNADNTVATNSPQLSFIRARGTYDTPTVVANGDSLGKLVFYGMEDGASWDVGAVIEAVVDGTPGTNDMPTRLTFSTCADGSVTPVVRLTIDNAGISTFAGAIVASSSLTMANPWLLTGTITPTQLNGNTDNWNPTNLATANVIRVDSSMAIDLTGIVAQTVGRVILLYNLGAFDITLTHDATSTAANRFFCPNATNFTLSQKESTWLRYDSASRWTVMGTA